ncbi:Hypothetical predicted protein [Olea europaea subsp. europaea]|uniref:Uncharacterized protein n=1 Tax=Olea europaea subsp. europaea TaxID=158383 RepID=A0A8S0V9P3_OLEEU|nr:Hypothetical predicted protein [Olea europaea subsp. europaea]
MGHHVAVKGQVAKGDEGRDVQDDVPEQADAPHEHNARPNDPTVLQKISIPEYGNVPSHIPVVCDRTDVIDATGDLGYIVCPPEGDHEVPVSMVRTDKASPVTKLHEQLTVISQQFDLYRAKSEQKHAETLQQFVEVLRRLDVHTLLHYSSAVSFTSTTVATSPISGRPQTSPTIAPSDQITRLGPIDIVPINISVASDPIPLPVGDKRKI